MLRPRRFEGISIVLYLVLGWTTLVVLAPLFQAVSLPSIILLGIGCPPYSFGVLFRFWHQLPHHNAVWHGFVIGAPLATGSRSSTASFGVRAA
ncbi:MAG: hypothetical protein AB7S71_01845 [Dongiaceae bacterium]